MIEKSPALHVCVRGGDEMNDLLAAFGSYGFPMAVTAFLLVRIEAKLGALNDSMRELSGVIAKK